MAAAFFFIKQSRNHRYHNSNPCFSLPSTLGYQLKDWMPWRIQCPWKPLWVFSATCCTWASEEGFSIGSWAPLDWISPYPSMRSVTTPLAELIPRHEVFWQKLSRCLVCPQKPNFVAKVMGFLKGACGLVKHSTYTDTQNFLKTKCSFLLSFRMISAGDFENVTRPTHPKMPFQSLRWEEWRHETYGLQTNSWDGRR